MIWTDCVVLVLMLIVGAIGSILCIFLGDEFDNSDSALDIVFNTFGVKTWALWVLKFFSLLIISYVVFSLMITNGVLFYGTSLIKFRETLNAGTGFVRFLGTIRADIILGALQSFLWANLIVVVSRTLVFLLSLIFSKTFSFIFCGFFGFIYGIVVLGCFTLLVMQIYGIIGGASTEVSNIFTGSTLRLDYLFANNPLKNVSLL